MRITRQKMNITACVVCGLLLSALFASAQTITTIAGNPASADGSGGLATDTNLGSVRATATDGAGNVYLLTANDTDPRIRKITNSTGIITTIAGLSQVSTANGTLLANFDLGSAYVLAIDPAGMLYFSSITGDGNYIRKANLSTGLVSTAAGTTGNNGYTGDGGPATNAQISSLTQMAFDAAGNMYFTQPFLNLVRRVSANTGIITTIAGTTVSGFLGDGGLAINARLSYPRGIAVDAAGNVFVADAANGRIRKITASTGIISTIAGTGAFGFSGDGGPASSAVLNGPGSLALSPAGDLFFFDEENARIRRITASTGIISTVVGNGTFGFSGDGGLATSASLSRNTTLSTTPSGNLLIADGDNGRVRQVSFQPYPVLHLNRTGGTVAVGSDGQAVSPSAVLDVKSTTQGVLLPRLTTAQRTAIGSPVTGLLVYDSDTPGFWVFQAGAWVSLTTSTNSPLVGWQQSGANVVSTVSGNVGIGAASPNAKLSVVSANNATGPNTAVFANPTLGPNQSSVHSGIEGNWYIRSAADHGRIFLQDSVASGRVVVGNGGNSTNYRMVVWGDQLPGLSAYTSTTNISQSAGLFISNTSSALRANSNSTARPTAALENNAGGSVLSVSSGGSLSFSTAADIIAVGTGAANSGGGLRVYNQSQEFFGLPTGSFANGGGGTAFIATTNGFTGGIIQPRLTLNGINTTDKTASLDFWGSGTFQAALSVRGSNELGVYSGPLADWLLRMNFQTGTMCSRSSIALCSDQRLKRDFRPLTGSLAKLMQIMGQHYFWKDAKMTGLQTGFVAQEIQKTFPELVQTDDTGFLSVNYTGFVPHLVEAVKELKTENNALRIENERLQAELAQLKTNGQRIEARLDAIERSLMKP